MSTSRGIAAVTDRLVTLLKQSSLTVTARPPDKARDGVSGNQLNLFLFQVTIHPGWRNQDLPRQAGRGEVGRPLLPLNLHYLITAYGQESTEPQTSDVIAHQFLGRAMLLLHDQPELEKFDPNSGIKNQTDPIRATVQPMSLDEMSKLWSAFQSAYRPSVAYELGTVLIESELPAAVPLPVVRRGDQDRGWDATTAPPPMLETVRFATARQPGMRLGETIVLAGRNLARSGSVQAGFRHAIRNVFNRVPVQASDISEDSLVLKIPDDAPDKWPVGVYTVVAQYAAEGSTHPASTNGCPVALLPEIRPPAAGLVVGAGNALALPCQPGVAQGQQIQVVIGSRQVADFAAAANMNVVRVTVPVGIRPQSAYARLRVDGVESMIYDPADPAAGFDVRFLVKNLPQENG